MPRYGWEFGPRYGYDFGYHPRQGGGMERHPRYDRGWGMTGLFNRVMGGPPAEDRDYDRPLRRVPRGGPGGWDDIRASWRGRGYDVGYDPGRGRSPRAWRYDAGW